MFGKVMSLPDRTMGIYHKLILGWMPSDVEELEAKLASGELHPNETKMKLAREIVSIFHSPEDAKAAQERWDEVFRGGSGIPDDIPQETLSNEEEIRDILVRLKMVSSRGEAKRMIQQDGVRLNEDKVSEVQATVTPDMLPAVLQVGKRKFVRLIKPE